MQTDLLTRRHEPSEEGQTCPDDVALYRSVSLLPRSEAELNLPLGTIAPVVY